MAASVFFALTFLPNNWWEEVAWMGFVQARLQDRRGPVIAAVLTLAYTFSFISRRKAIASRFSLPPYWFGVQSPASRE